MSERKRAHASVRASEQQIAREGQESERKNGRERGRGKQERKRQNADARASARESTRGPARAREGPREHEGGGREGEGRERARERAREKASERAREQASNRESVWVGESGTGRARARETRARARAGSRSRDLNSTRERATVQSRREGGGRREKCQCFAARGSLARQCSSPSHYRCRRRRSSSSTTIHKVQPLSRESSTNVSVRWPLRLAAPSPPGRKPRRTRCQHLFGRLASTQFEEASREQSMPLRALTRATDEITQGDLAEKKQRTQGARPTAVRIATRRSRQNEVRSEVSKRTRRRARTVRGRFARTESRPGAEAGVGLPTVVALVKLA
eukprot:298760-Pleurochrysis_carterae.AAC.2